LNGFAVSRRVITVFDDTPTVGSGRQPKRGYPTFDERRGSS
jgi:hypothetical protein